MIVFPATPYIGQVWGPGNGYLYVYDGTRWVGQTSSNFGDSTITQSGAINITNPLPSTSPTTGALTVAGGAGITGDLYVGGVIHSSNNTSTISGSASALVNGAFTATLDSSGNLYIPGYVSNTNTSSYGIEMVAGYPGQGISISNNSGYQVMFVQDDGAYIQTSANNSGTVFNTWAFGTNGQLQLPVTGVIGDTYGDGLGAGIAAGSASNSYAGINNYTGDQWVEADNTAVYIGTNYLTNGGYQWTFDKSGSLTFPDHTVQTTAYTGGGSGISSTFTGTFTTKDLVINNDLVINKTGGSNFVSGNDLTLKAAGQINMFGDLYIANRAEFSDGTMQSTAYTGTVAWTNITNRPTPEAFKPTTFNPVKIITNGPIYTWYSTYGDSLNLFENLGASSVYDSTGNLYVVGTVCNSTDNFGIILKYSPTGQLLWEESYKDTGVTSTLQFEGVSTDSNDNLYVLVTSAVGGKSTTILKFNTSSTITIDATLPVSQNLAAEEIAIDDSGNIYVVGEDNTTNNMFVVKINSSGAVMWANEFALSGSTNMGISGICTDNSFVYIITGQSESSSNAVTTKLSQSDGSIIWSQQIAGGIGIGVGVDRLGNVYSAYIGGGIIKYNSSGVAQWQLQIPSIPTLPVDIIVAGDGYIYISGVTNLNFSTYVGNLFWIKIDSNGSILGQYQFSNNNNVGVWATQGHRCTAVNTNGGVLSIAGYTGVSYLQSQILTIQIPTDGSLSTGSIGDFAYTRETFSTTLLTSNISSSNSGFSKVNEGWTATTLTINVNINTATTYTSTTVNALATSQNSTWTFGLSGLLTLPNGTILGANPPAHSYGKLGDLAGMVAYTTSTMYYCTGNYVNNSTNIWAKVAFTLSTF